MKLTWYPKNLFVAAVLLVTFAGALNLAVDFRRGAIVSVLALIAYVGLEFLLTFNAAQWWRNRSSRA
jgi:hypothetical protein